MTGLIIRKSTVIEAPNISAHGKLIFTVKTKIQPSD